MRRALACLPLALLFIANVVPAKAQKTAQAGGEEVEVRVREGDVLELACALRVEQPAEWRRDGGALPPGLAPAGEALAGVAGVAGEAPAPGAALTVRLRAAAARPHHAGVYACARGPGAQRLRVVVEPAAASGPGETTTAAAATPDAAAVRPGDAGADADSDIFYFDLSRPNNISLRCPLPNADKLGYVWQVNGTALEQVGALSGRYRLAEDGALFVLEARSLEDDWGVYRCALAQGAATHEWRVHARAVAKLSPNTNVVEGQKLKLVCRVIGKPAPPVQWRYRNNSDDAPEAGIEVTDPAALGERAQLNASEAQVAGAQLVLEAARLDDAGRYSCVPLGPEPGRAPQAAAHTVLRVKDMYAALWPFLGICAEVLVLCVVILVYEKRRTKPELDDSDTDNHDQKKS